jgi:hypothetical protein
MFRQIYVWLRSSLFWDVTQPILVVSYGLLGTTSRSHFQGSSSKLETNVHANEKEPYLLSQREVTIIYRFDLLYKVCLCVCNHSRTSQRIFVLLDIGEFC